MPKLVEVEDLWFRYRHGGRPHGDIEDEWVLKGLNFHVELGSSLGVVGESGSGKSTLVRVLCGLLFPQSGSILFADRPVDDWRRRSIEEFRASNQMVFQSPASSIDPRMRMQQALAEPVKAIERRKPTPEEMVGWLDRVGLGPEVLSRYPHQLSGGQLQRIAIARALSVHPKILYADEPTSALDVSVQAQVLNLLMELRAELGLTLVVVSHDLAVISRICESIVVMKDGEIVEAGDTVDVVTSPQSAYTQSLVSAADAVSLFSSSPAD